MFSNNLFWAIASQGNGGGSVIEPPTSTFLFEFTNTVVDTTETNTFSGVSGNTKYTTVGDNTYINVNNQDIYNYTLIDNTTTSSHSFWFKTTLANTVQIVYGTGSWTSILRISSANEVYAMIYINGSWYYTPYTAISIGSWVNVGFSWDVTSKIVKYYVNGNLIDTINYTTFGSISNNNFQLGYDSFSAQISYDKLRIYQNTVLSDTDFLNIYNYDSLTIQG